jgi:hypothetical protein
MSAVCAAVSGVRVRASGGLAAVIELASGHDIIVPSSAFFELDGRRGESVESAIVLLRELRSHRSPILVVFKFFAHSLFQIVIHFHQLHVKQIRS